MNENLINRLLSVIVGGTNSNLCYEAATEIQQLNIEVQRLNKLLLEKPVMADAKKVASPKQHYEYIAEAEAALIKHKDAEYAKLQREFLELSKEAVSKQQEYYQQQIDMQADQEFGFYAAHAMGAMLNRGSYVNEDLAYLAFDYARAMVDHKKKMKEVSQSYQAPGVLGGAQQQYGNFNPNHWACSHCNKRNDKLFSRCSYCGQKR